MITAWKDYVPLPYPMSSSRSFADNRVVIIAFELIPGQFGFALRINNEAISKQRSNLTTLEEAKTTADAELKSICRAALAELEE
jgi:hypothetical protein